MSELNASEFGWICQSILGLRSGYDFGPYQDPNFLAPAWNMKFFNELQQQSMPKLIEHGRFKPQCFIPGQGYRGLGVDESPPIQFLQKIGAERASIYGQNNLGLYSLAKHKLKLIGIDDDSIDILTHFLQMYLQNRKSSNQVKEENQKAADLIRLAKSLDQNSKQMSVTDRMILLQSLHKIFEEDPDANEDPARLITEIPDDEPPVKPEGKPGDKPGGKSDVKAGAQPDAKGDAEIGAKTDAKGASVFRFNELEWLRLKQKILTFYVLNNTPFRHMKLSEREMRIVEYKLKIMRDDPDVEEFVEMPWEPIIGRAVPMETETTVEIGGREKIESNFSEVSAAARYTHAIEKGSKPSIIVSTKERYLELMQHLPFFEKTRKGKLAQTITSLDDLTTFEECQKLALLTLTPLERRRAAKITDAETVEHLSSLDQLLVETSHIPNYGEILTAHTFAMNFFDQLLDIKTPLLALDQTLTDFTKSKCIQDLMTFLTKRVLPRLGEPNRLPNNHKVSRYHAEGFKLNKSLVDQLLAFRTDPEQNILQYFGKLLAKTSNGRKLTLELKREGQRLRSGVLGMQKIFMDIETFIENFQEGRMYMAYICADGSCAKNHLRLFKFYDKARPQAESLLLLKSQIENNYSKLLSYLDPHEFHRVLNAICPGYEDEQIERIESDLAHIAKVEADRKAAAEKALKEAEQAAKLAAEKRAAEAKAAAEAAEKERLAAEAAKVKLTDLKTTKEKAKAIDQIDRTEEGTGQGDAVAKEPVSKAPQPTVKKDAPAGKVSTPPGKETAKKPLKEEPKPKTPEVKPKTDPSPVKAKVVPKPTTAPKGEIQKKPETKEAAKVKPNEIKKTDVKTTKTTSKTDAAEKTKPAGAKLVDSKIKTADPKSPVKAKPDLAKGKADAKTPVKAKTEAKPGKAVDAKSPVKAKPEAKPDLAKGKADAKTPVKGKPEAKPGKAVDAKSPVKAKPATKPELTKGKATDPKATVKAKLEAKPGVSKLKTADGKSPAKGKADAKPKLTGAKTADPKSATDAEVKTADSKSTIAKTEDPKSKTEADTKSNGTTSKPAVGAKAKSATPEKAPAGVKTKEAKSVSKKPISKTSAKTDGSKAGLRGDAATELSSKKTAKDKASAKKASTKDVRKSKSGVAKTKDSTKTKSEGLKSKGGAAAKKPIAAKAKIKSAAKTDGPKKKTLGGVKTSVKPSKDSLKKEEADPSVSKTPKSKSPKQAKVSSKSKDLGSKKKSSKPKKGA